MKTKYFVWLGVFIAIVLAVLNFQNCGSEFQGEVMLDSDGKIEEVLEAKEDEKTTLDGYTIKTAKDLGYQPDPNMMCTMAIEQMIHLEKGICVMASDGCQAGYLKSIGFVNDSEGKCDSQ